nr:MAG TPA: hypothetical protein [Caudoviricetes sp.]
MIKIKSPCDRCKEFEKCTYKDNKGCFIWKTWFRCYWQALRIIWR